RRAVGIQNVLLTKADLRSVEVRYSYSLGAVVAFAKPYYFSVYPQGSRHPVSMAFNSAEFIPGTIISGRAACSEGIAEMGFYHGATAKFNVSFEYAPYTNIIRAVETGISLDYFPRALPILAFNNPENFVITFHVGFVFGRKWF